MALFFVSLLVIALVMAGMSVGVLAGRSPIKGTCGGIGALGVDAACELCGGDPRRCDEQTRNGEAGQGDPNKYYRAD